MEHPTRKELDREFQDFYLSSSIPSMKVGLSVTLLLFFLYAVINRVVFGDTPEQQYFMKFGTIVPLLLIPLVALFINPLKHYIRLIFIFVNLGSCMVIYFVGANSDIHGQGYKIGRAHV